MLKDQDIREPLFDFFDEKFGKVRIIEEKQIAKSRADVMLVLEEEAYWRGNQKVMRIHTQGLQDRVKDYNKFFDYNYVVVGSSHSKHIEEHVPEYWGIIEAISKEESVEFNVLREPEINKRAQRTYKMKRKLSILWRPELSHIQEINGMPKYKQRSKDFVITKIMEKVQWDLLHRQISEELFQRDYNTISEAIKEWRSSNKH
ncbi:MAG: sce7726 family protein [Eubacterium ventriosum]